ncbi:HNH endonuclease [Actinotignum urinale]|uniref:type II CRISPR RNA-guided endonuclease Cas9 n=1 Tax=Actinotignum urinale TaxID=190146 RepID=UPI000C8099D1|nr:type II CRISPR RNA-guided endonuclease Cas9 [Actinotignum urinale]WIK59321.1 HNH endonuclease [Actinotignum urinale]
MNAFCTYRVGIDVGTNSVGFAAIKVDEHNTPQKVLNNLVVLHDSGVDPKKATNAKTRLATSGVARRTRRLYQQRRKRLQDLDNHIQALGWPIIDHEESPDPYLPWKTRASLATEPMEEDKLGEALSIAVRHMARHRGWRSPYERIENLFIEKPASSQFEAMKTEATKATGVLFDDDVTPAQVVVEMGLCPDIRLRTSAGNKYSANSVKGGENVAGKDKIGIFAGKLMQSDNAGELLKIGKIQNLNESLVKDLIRWVFQAKSPKGAATQRAGFDELPGQEKFKRLAKDHPEFQEFKIIQVVANIRVKDGSGLRALSPEEKNTVIDFLMDDHGEDGITWSDVADLLGLKRRQLHGVSSQSPDGERPSTYPPSNSTNRAIYRSKIKSLIEWWKNADTDEQNAMVKLLSNSDVLDTDEPGSESAEAFLSSLDENTLAKIDTDVKLPAGRASYSLDSIRRLNQCMFKNSVDLHEARKIEFGVDDSWVPPTEPIGAPVGNPAVDRVLKIVNRWITATEKKWGTPISVNIEHVRDALQSEKRVREYEKENKQRYERNQKIVQEAHDTFGITIKPGRYDITRYVALRRQNCQCVYCGTPIDFHNAQMDHIIPRKGVGSTSTRDNLVAICEVCNKTKSNLPFGVWAESSARPGVSVKEAVVRVRAWKRDDGLTAKQEANFKKDVIARLTRTVEDAPIDNRSIESVAWMARELRERIAGHYRQQGNETTVNVYRGWITSEARKASGFENKVNFIGGHGKIRLDRRHHAMDAATIALMSDTVAQVLTERNSIREAEYIKNVPTKTWKEYRGSTPTQRVIYGKWLNSMNQLLFLFNEELYHDSIPVMQSLRLRLGNGTAHDAIIRKMVGKQVGSAWSKDEIDRASTPQMWIALSRDPDFSEKDGLPENPHRELRIKNEWFKANETIPVFPKKIAAIAVRNGYAEVGDTIHHVRLYAIPGKKTTYGMVRVFGFDLVQHKDKDLFNVPLGPETLSMRDAKPVTRNAILEGKAEYLGWLVRGTELELDLSHSYFHKNAIGEFLNDFPDNKRWVVKRHDSNSTITLRPLIISSEGLDKFDLSDGSLQIISTKGKGWKIAVNALLGNSLVKKIHRNALGEERETSNCNLPVTTVLKD